MPENVLDHISIEGFKSIASIEQLQLNPINVVIGPNGSGKSNFIGVFAFLHAIREGQLGEFVARSGGAEKVLHFGSKRTQVIRFELAFGLEQYRVTLRAAANDQLYESTSKIRTESGYRPAAAEAEGGLLSQYKQWLLDRMLAWRIYHFEDTSFSSPMRKTAKVDDNRYLREDAGNLPAFLHLLRERHKDSYELILRTIRQVAPFFEDFRLSPLELNPDDIKLEWRHKNSEQYFDVSALSDGTLRFMALATLFLQPERFRPSLILVDEPELGLHPYALGMLASLIHQASVSTQVIVSTQSSVLLDHFEPKDVIVADLVDGGTQLSRLDSKRLEKWLEDYSLGQLWEKNEIGGRPSPVS